MTARRPIHQLVHTLSYGDAISTEVLALQSALRELGLESEIYALHEHNRLKGRSRKFQAIGECAEADLILHYSIGSPLNDLYAHWNRGHRVLVYHNITPSRWFRGVNNRVANDIERGLSDLPALCRKSDRVWADSAFNAREIEALGFQASVLELPIAPERWDRPRDEAMFSRVKRRGGVNILHVGRMAPNKCVEDIIKSFYYLNKFIAPKSTLWLAGIDTDTELYSFSLRRLIRNLGLDDSVEILGGLTDEEVRSLYEASSAYVCMSEHEGFCLPLVEAMHFGLPVVAFGAGAVAETVGDGGIVLSEKRHAEIGDLFLKIAQPGDLRTRLIAKGKERVGSFSFGNFKGRLAELLGGAPRQQEAHGA
jgi:glycosyltransferase involved in cell wall biosynthesis